MAAPVTSDVLVIGGGPAGTAAAITCARAGLSVSLIEGREFPRHRPGETLHPGIEPLLERLGVAGAVRSSGFLRHAGIWLLQSGRAEFQPYGADANGPWLGFQAPRGELDAILLAAARSQGVVVHQPHRALRVILLDHRVAGAETTAGPIRSAFTIDASGSPSWLARRLNLHISRTGRRLIARYGYMRGECRTRDDAPCFEYLPDGWVWTARVRPSLYHWTRLSTTGRHPRHGWSPPEFADLQPAAPVRGADVSWTTVDACAGPGYYLAGDAAALTDPSSSKGVLHSLMSGMLAADQIARCLLQNAPDHRLCAQYSTFIRSWFRFNVAHNSDHFLLTPRSGAEKFHRLRLDRAGLAPG